MTQKIFITGTDTGVGKTYVSVGLLNDFNQQGLTTLGIKPIASGCVAEKNEDALLLQQHASIKLAYQHINPFAFAEPIAPHIAAAIVQCELSVALLNQHLQTAFAAPADVCIIEGAGGLHVPLNQHETMADFVSHNQLAVILVVGMRLGCINHSILTHAAMLQRGINVIGWVANCITPDMAYCQENIKTLQHWLPSNHLGTIGYNENPAKLSLSSLLNNGRITSRKCAHISIR